MLKSRWGYILIASLLALIWLEFWRSMRHANPPGNSPTTNAPASQQSPLSPNPAAVVAPPVAEDRDSTLRQIAEDLAGTPPQRLAARQKLAQIPVSQRTLLRHLANEARDKDVREPLADRLDELDAELALHPPPISIHIQNGTLDDVARALGRELDIPIEGPPNTPPAYTLDLSNKPFWEIFTALHAQGHIGLASTASSLIFRDAPPLAPQFRNAGGALRIENFATSGNFLAYASMTRTSFGAAAGYTLFTLSCTLVADPRLHPFDATPEFTFGPDDAGSTFTLDDGTRPGLITRPPPSPFIPRFGGGPILVFSVPLKANSGTPGTVLTSFKLHARVLLATSIISADLDDIESKVGQTLAIGPTAVTLQRFDHRLSSAAFLPSENPGITFQFAGDAAPGAAPSHLRLTLLDANGNTRWIGPPGAYSTYGNAPSPIRLHAEIPRKSVETEVSLEIKDIPLPQ